MAIETNHVIKIYLPSNILKVDTAKKSLIDLYGTIKLKMRTVNNLTYMYEVFIENFSTETLSSQHNNYIGKLQYTNDTLNSKNNLQNQSIFISIDKNKIVACKLNYQNKIFDNKNSDVCLLFFYEEKNQETIKDSLKETKNDEKVQSSSKNFNSLNELVADQIKRYNLTVY